VKVESPVFSHADEIRRGEGFAVLADRRIFAVFAFLNVVGYDEEVPGQQMTPVRLKLRERLQKTLTARPDKLKAWRQYYRKMDAKEYIYVNYALGLSADYPFRRIRARDEYWSPTLVDHLEEFPSLLNDFWLTAHLEELWHELKPDYLAEMQQYDLAQMAADMDGLWRYLRLPKQTQGLVIAVPNPISRHFQATGTRFGEIFYSVDGPGSNNHSLNTHESLHPITQPILRASFESHRAKLEPYFRAAQRTDAAQPYGTLFLFVDECLVHALDARLRIKLSKNPESTRRWAENDVDKLTKDGLNLTGPFYRLLGGYENSDRRFDEYMPELLDAVPEYNAALTRTAAH